MKIKNLACIASLLVASLSGAQAQTTLTAWTFDNLALGANSSPQPATGFGTASATGLGSSQSVVSLAGSSTGGANSWQLGGWTTSAAIGSQGAQFGLSTVGYYQVQVSFDVYATVNAEASLLVQYTTEGTIWHNATITSAGTLGVLATNTITTNSLVVGTYVILTNNGTAGWDNQVTVNLSGISGVDNDANFAIRIVNASTGTNCLDTTGTEYVNNTGTWTLDNVVVQGVSYDTVADWIFDDQYVKNKIINNPTPAISNNTASASCIGFNQTYNFPSGATSSTNSADITQNGAPYSSTGPSGQAVWRLRGAPGNGWISTQPIGTQGAEFDVSTVNYSNILVNFDLYFTTQGEAKMCVLYTTDGWATTQVANNLGYGANPTFIVTNSVTDPLYSANTVTGTYLFNNYGSIFFNNMIIDFTGVPGVDNNPNFAFRIVNAATGSDCINYLGQPYNNNSGNCRLDNVSVNGQFEGQYAPTVTNSPSASVDAPFTNTFAINPTWVAAIKSVYVNANVLTNTAYTLTSSNIVFNPAKSTALQSSGFDNIVIFATGFTSAKLSQYVATGAARKLSFTQPAGPSASGGTLTLNPVIGLTDQYGNGTTNPYAAMTVTATVSNSVAWTLGGSTNQPIVNGFCVFTDLTATVTGATAVTGAAIKFTVTGYTNSANHSTTTNFYSTLFNIGAPPVPFTAGNLAVIQIDTLSNNTTFSVIELQPSTAGQTKPVNIVPISATGANALRLASAGSCGKLALSDDGTFLVFDAFQDGSAATPDETFNLNRAVGTLNYTNGFTSPVGYVSTSYGGSQARAACSPDNKDFLICDKGGLYVDNALVYQQNNVSTRSFGGIAWVQTAKAAFPPVPSLYEFAGETEVGETSIEWGDPGNNGPVSNPTDTPPQDPDAQDFYMIATNGTYGILYVLDQNAGAAGANGIINKWALNSDGFTWTPIGSWTNADNGDTLFTTTNGSGGVYIYYANGGGGAGGNQLIRLTDQTVGGPLNLIATNVIYTAPANTSIEGVTFVPQQAANASELTPPPILSAQVPASVGGTFAITNTPDDSLWRSSITAITVNGSVLPPAAYDTTQTGLIVFDPSQSALLQTPGAKAIVISATGYSTNFITQPLSVGAAAQLVVTTQPTAPLGDGGALTQQPVVKIEDLYGNVVTNSASITAAAVQNTWTLGGTLTVATTGTSGTATFAGLTAFSVSAVTGATISFTAGAATATSLPFNISAPIQSLLGGAGVTNGKFGFTFTNITGLSYSVLATNDLTAPVTTWPVVGTVIENPAGSGNYQFTNSPATNGLLFYILRQP